MGGDNGEKGGRVFRDIYKGYMNKTKVSGVGGGDRWGGGEWWEENGDNCA